MEHIDWKVEWSESLSVGNPIIDAEHQYFLMLLNDLNSALNEPPFERETISAAMSMLLGEARSHFEHEERLFSEKRYPGAEVHGHHHAALIRRLSEIQDTFSSTDYDENWAHLGLEIKTKMTAHILTVDHLYIEFLASQKKENAPVEGTSGDKE